MTLKKWTDDIAIALDAFGEPRCDEPIPIERDASGVPTAWRVAKYGPWTVTRNGETYVLLDVTEDVVERIVAYYRERGNQIPLDSRHFLYRLAEKLNVSELDIVRMLPDGEGTFGFCGLEKRADGLWAVNVEFVPLGREMIAEGIIRYFSPVIRGLSTQQYRVTSIAMENVPATDHQLSFAASAEERTLTMSDLVSRLDAVAASAERMQKMSLNHNQETVMSKLLLALATLPGLDSVALGANQDVDDAVAAKITALGKEIPGLRRISDAARDAVALAADAEPAAVAGALAGLKLKAAGHDELKIRVDALALAAEENKLNQLIEQGKAAGKLTNAMVTDWIRGQKMDSVALGAALPHLPVVVPLDRAPLGQPPPAADAVALSAEEEEMILEAGIKREDYIANRPKAR